MTGIAAATAPIVNIDIVICTYNRAANLDEVLSALSAQRVGSDVIWSRAAPQPGLPMFTGPQCRAARGLLGWSVQQLAEAAGVSWRSVQRAKAATGIPRMHVATLEKIQNGA
jgi:hypothetical protein